MSSRAFQTPSVNFMVRAVKPCGCAAIPTRDGGTKDSSAVGQGVTVQYVGQVEWFRCQGVVNRGFWFLVENVSDRESVEGPIDLLKV
jgi:hypothetical protein